MALKDGGWPAGRRLSPAPWGGWAAGRKDIKAHFSALTSGGGIRVISGITIWQNQKNRKTSG
jgi:hypothetical protein